MNLKQINPPFQQYKRTFSTLGSSKGGIKIGSADRIGPHNLDVISLIVGSLLGGNTFLEKRRIGFSIRIIFVKCNNNVAFLMWFHMFLAKRGYCNPNKPKLSKIIAKGNKVLFSYCISSYSFSSFYWLFKMFYRDNIKIIPRNLGNYLTPLALAIWFLEVPIGPYGLGNKAKLATEFHVSREDLKYLSKILKKYNIDTIIQSKGGNLGGTLYIKTSSISTFSKIVKPNILPSLYYKLNGHHVKLSLPGSSGLHFSSLSSSLKLRENSPKIEFFFSTKKDPSM